MTSSSMIASSVRTSPGPVLTAEMAVNGIVNSTSYCGTTAHKDYLYHNFATCAISCPIPSLAVSEKSIPDDVRSSRAIDTTWEL